MNDYILTVGLEIHAQLRTKTKMFCDSKNDPDELRPNANICPICMGHPGTLPTINKEAVRHVLKVGIALGGTLADFTEFDRKNYFYPDIPKGYQLSQYEFPLVRGGELRGVKITRVHLEEDTATSLHKDSSILPFRQLADKGSGESASRGISKSSVLKDSDTSFSKGGIKSEGFSLIDFNRAGVPLMELVTEPVIRSAKEAGDFARELQLLLRYLGVSDANMEKGEMRIEANISLSKKSEGEEGELGTKVEVKNLNSFRAVERAIAYEAERHASLLDLGEKVKQETRGWDENTGKTFSQRSKEEAEDYRYFPDPDLPKLVIREIPEFKEEILRKEMPELPDAKRARYRELSLKESDIETLVGSRSLSNLFEAMAKGRVEKEALLLAANYLTSDLLGLIKKHKLAEDPADFLFTPEAIAELILMVTKKELSSRGAKDVLAVLFEKGGDPRALAMTLGLLQQNDKAGLRKVAEGIIAANEKVALDYKGGKMAALQFLVGQGMKATKGAANPEMLREIFVSLLR